jgi:antitoxin component of MazEF toxin-antitoxin module
MFSMKVQDETDLGNGHLIEIGAATWDSSQKSVRNRHPASNGGSSLPCSSEIPLGDIGAIVDAVAKRDLLDVGTLTRLIKALSASRDRLTGTPSLQSLLDRVTDENRHSEIQTGPAVGNEVW